MGQGGPGPRGHDRGETRFPSAAPTKSADSATIWAATKDFRGPAAKPLSPWEMLAQVLLMSNEFMFVD